MMADDDKPRGLRFVVEVVNSPDAPAAWREIVTRHGGGDLAERAVDDVALTTAAAEVRAVFADVDPEAAALRLNQALAGAGPDELVRVEDGRWVLRPSFSPTADAAGVFRVLAGFSLGQWLVERGRCAWGVCAATGCEQVFVDEGRRAPQRFCSTACSTRTRVAQYRQRVR